MEVTISSIRASIVRYYWLFGWLELLVTLFPMLAVTGVELRRELRWMG